MVRAQGLTNTLVRVPTNSQGTPSIPSQKLELVGIGLKRGVDLFLTTLVVDFFGQYRLFLQLTFYPGQEGQDVVEIILEPAITRSMFVNLSLGKTAGVLLNELLFPVSPDDLEHFLENAAAVVLTRDLVSCSLKLISPGGHQEMVEAEVVIASHSFVGEAKIEELETVVEIWQTWL